MGGTKSGSHVRPLSVSQISGNNLTDGLPELTMLLGDESGINWPVCCNCMKRDKRVFSPHWSFEGPPLPPPLHDDIQQKQQHDPKTVTHLFYMRDEDLFLLLKISSSPSSVLPSTNTAASTTIITSTATGNLLAASIVEKNEVANLERRRMALQKFANFLLHYIWQNLWDNNGNLKQSYWSQKKTQWARAAWYYLITTRRSTRDKQSCHELYA